MGLVYGDGLDDIKDCLGGGCGLDKILPSKKSNQVIVILTNSFPFMKVHFGIPKTVILTDCHIIACHINDIIRWAL